MKIRKKIYHFEKGEYGGYFSYERLSPKEIEEFVRENIEIINGVPKYKEDRIPTYWDENNEKYLSDYIYIQIGVFQCVKVEYRLRDYHFQYINYKNPDVKMMVLYKQ